MSVCGEVGHQTYHSFLCPAPRGMDVPCAFASHLLAEVKGGLAPRRDHRPAREGRWGQCSLSGGKANQVGAKVWKGSLPCGSF